MHKLLAITRTFISKYWVIFFIFFCAAAFELSSLQSREKLLLLSQQLADLQGKAFEAKALNKKLNAIILSQEDPNWIDLTLRRKLSMAAENENKVFFQPP